jgi:hypothetical protein
MEKEICYKNHHKMKEIHKFLISEDGKKYFKNKVKMLKEPESKKIMLTIFEKNWKQYEKLIDIIQKLCLNVNKHKLSNKSVQKYVDDLYKVLNKIHNYKQLHKFIYKLLEERVLYNRVVKFYEILSDKSKCVLLFK